MPINEGKIYNSFFLAILVVAIIVVVLCLCQCYKSNFVTMDPKIDSNTIGVNVSLTTNLIPESCPVTSLNEFQVANNLGISKYREWYADSLAVALSYIKPNSDSKTIATPIFDVQTRIRNIMQYLNDSGARFTIVLNTNYWNCNNKCISPTPTNNRNTYRPFDSGLTFSEMMSATNRNGDYIVEAVHLGLDGGSKNQIEVSLRQAQKQSGNTNPITKVVSDLLDHLPPERKTGNLDVIISAQGDTCVNSQAIKDKSNICCWGEIFGPPNISGCKESNPWSVSYSNLIDPIRNQLSDLNSKKGIFKNIYLATTKYPYYYTEGVGTDMTISMPNTYAETIMLYIQSVNNLNTDLKTTFKPMIAETGWPSTCDGGIKDDKGHTGTIPNLNPKKIRASNCNQSNMWKYFVNPMYSLGTDTYDNTGVNVNGTTYLPSDYSTAIKEVERFWWVLSGDGTHVDCYNPANSPAKGGIGAPQHSVYYRDNGWSMFTKRGDFKYPYPNLTIIPNQGSERPYPPCKLQDSDGCPTYTNPGTGEEYKYHCCSAGQNVPGINARTGEYDMPCCSTDTDPTQKNPRQYVNTQFC